MLSFSHVYRTVVHSVEALRYLALSSALLLMAACGGSDNDTAPPPAPLPDTVTFSSPGLYPEGIAFEESSQSFFISSISRGTVSRVSPDGEISTFIDSDQLVSTIGMHIDVERNRLIVCNSDPGAGLKSSAATVGTLAAVAIYDLDSGEQLDYIDLAALDPGQPHFANDVTMDEQGNIYVTDSFSPNIYQIDADGTASIFTTNPEFSTPAGSFGLNGIVFQANNTLIVSHGSSTTLFNVPLDTPDQAQAIIVDQPLGSVDGLAVLDNETIVAVTNSFSDPSGNTIVRLNSENGWESADVDAIVATGDDLPTTAAVVNGDTFVVFAQFATLFSGNDPELTQDNFFIQRALF